MVQQSLFDDVETQTSQAAASASRRLGAFSPAERAAWQEWKARALPGFVAPYCQALAASRLHRSCWWVDGLAAAGRSQPPLESAAGAVAEALAASGFALRPLRLESQPPKSQRPQAAASALPTPAAEGPASKTPKGRKPGGQESPAAQESPASASRSDLPALLGQAPAILLLNPFATPPLTADDLLPLCQRHAPTELLLTLSAAQLAQLAEQYQRPAARNGTSPDQAAAQPHPLTALLRSDTWKAIWAEEGRAAEHVARTLDLLRGLLKPHFLYVCLAPLDEAPTPRRFLLFASRQYASLTLMSDFLCAERARVARERETQALQGGWFARRREAARAKAWAALKEELHTLGLLRRARLWPDLKPALVLAHFGQFSTAEHDAALLELIEEGRVQCRWSPNTSPTTPAGDPDGGVPQGHPGAAPGADFNRRNEARIPGQQDFLEFIEQKTRPVWRR
jgi:hypothetical protein